MDEKEIQTIGRLAFSQSLKPLSRKGMIKHAYIMGFDTEFDSNTGELISRQYSFLGNTYFLPVESNNCYNVEQIIRDVGKILSDAKIDRQGTTNTVYLACYYSLAEISKIVGFFEDPRVRVREFSQTLNASIRVHRKLRIVIFDMYHFFMSSLEKAAKMYGLEKVKGIDRKNITRKDLQSEEFIRYAIRDAILCEQILERFRKELWRTYQVDILRTETPASTALSVYRQNYLCGVIKNENMVLRRNALRSYWGGRSEAFFRGTRTGRFHSCDITSLYPNAAILLQRLPREKDWIRTNSLDEILDGDVIDGFVRIRFQFPKNTRFPCLPVFSKRLLFPLSGYSNCTIAELRVASSMGAHIILLDGWYYTKGTNSLGVFLNEQLRKKDLAESNNNEPERHLHKLLANAIIGKFVQRIVKTPISYYQDLARKHAIPLSEAYHLHDTEFPRVKKISLGAGWCPEWGALILGKARSLMAKLLKSCPDCYHISTDSLLLKDTSVPFFDKESKKIGLQWKDEYGLITDVLIIRSKLYVLSQNGEIKKCAHHALHLPAKKSGKILLAAWKRNKEWLKYRKKKSLKLRESMRTGKKFFSLTTISMKLSLNWDQKRSLVLNGSTTPLQDISNSIPI